MADKPTQLLLPGILLEEFDEFVTSLSGLKDRIEAGEDILYYISWIETQFPLFLDKLKENSNEQLRSVTVDWTGPFFIHDVLKMTNENDCGIYQIYGHHRVFGEAALLYIGETDQTFGERIAKHKGWVQETEGNFIYVGRIVSDYDAYERRQLIKDTEALTIKWHSPPYNSNNIGRYNGRLLKVVNTGKYGSLLPKYESRKVNDGGRRDRRSDEC